TAAGTARHGHARPRTAGHVHRLSSWPPKWPAAALQVAASAPPSTDTFANRQGKPRGSSRAPYPEACRDAATKPGDRLQDLEKRRWRPEINVQEKSARRAAQARARLRSSSWSGS